MQPDEITRRKLADFLHAVLIGFCMALLGACIGSMLTESPKIIVQQFIIPEDEEDIFSAGGSAEGHSLGE
jgi:hypothetical protein